MWEPREDVRTYVTTASLLFTSYVVMRGACGLRLSHWRLLGFSVCGRCVARTREAHLDARVRIYMSVLPVARLLSLRARAPSSSSCT
jgi:hypothetical protein